MQQGDGFRESAQPIYGLRAANYYKCAGILARPLRESSQRTPGPITTAAKNKEGRRPSAETTAAPRAMSAIALTRGSWRVRRDDALMRGIEPQSIAQEETTKRSYAIPFSRWTSALACRGCPLKQSACDGGTV